MRFDEHDDRDPRVKEYIEFARSKAVKIKGVDDAKQILASSARSIQLMYHTFSGCDWCDECGGGSIAMGEEQYEAEQAIKYLLAQGEEIEITPTCHGCFHYEATHMSVNHRKYSDWKTPMCDKCGDLSECERETIPDNERECGIWYVGELRRASGTP